MLDTLLEKKLKALIEKGILVVMDDGLAFVGTLTDLDENTIVLRDVFQGSSMDIDWGEISEESSAQDFKDKIESDAKFGFIDWTKIRLKEVYIQVEHVTRIWPWKSPASEEGDIGRYKSPYGIPVYNKIEAGVESTNRTENPLK
ncbi:MAG: hypothetical protein R6U61_00800 [Thermoplasmata archaeon]